eukprot:snap_masked-scaffold_35-processed-gene-1.20-mRNA-1 protein AED:1.00 eAED:1.00 QI:0/-1/0/0/-1/1/1/0/74
MFYEAPDFCFTFSRFSQKYSFKHYLTCMNIFIKVRDSRKYGRLNLQVSFTILMAEIETRNKIRRNILHGLKKKI